MDADKIQFYGKQVIRPLIFVSSPNAVCGNSEKDCFWRWADFNSNPTGTVLMQRNHGSKFILRSDCKFDPQNAEAKAAVEAWHKEQSARAFDERYFAILMGAGPEIGQGLSNYHLW